MEEQTPQPVIGIPIQPVNFPLNQGTAVYMSVLIHNFVTHATTCSTYWQLLDADGRQLSQGTHALTEEQYAEWGQDNNFVNQIVADAIGVVLI